MKGGDAETDAGYQGLMSQATADDPDVLFSLYADAGCIGTIRGRASLGIETPVITTNICVADEVLSQVGDDALGWYFVGGQTEETGTPERADLDAIVELAGATEAAELGLGVLWLQQMLALAQIANTMTEGGEESPAPRSTNASARRMTWSRGRTATRWPVAPPSIRTSATSAFRSVRTSAKAPSRPSRDMRHSTPSTCCDVVHTTPR